MDEQKQGTEDSDQQKKVTFDEQKEDNAPSKENKDQEHEDTEEEGRRSRTGRTSRASSADAFNGITDEDKLKRTQNEENNKTEKGNNDMKDGLGDDLELLENSYKLEESKENSRNETDEVNDNKKAIVKSSYEENSVKDEANKTDTITEEAKTEPVNDDKNVESEREGQNFGSAGNSLKSQSPKNEQNFSTEESKSKTSNKDPEKTTKYISNKEKEAEFRSSVSSLSSEEDSSGTKTESTRFKDLKEDENKKHTETNKTIKSEKDKQTEEMKAPADNSKDEGKPLQPKEEVKDDLRKDEEHLHYQTDDVNDNVHSDSPKPVKEKETKVTIKISETKPANNEPKPKPQQRANIKKETAPSLVTRKQTLSSSKPPVLSPSQSYPRPARKETSSPREIVANERKERRQKSQSARYPSQGKSSSRDVTMTTRASSRASTVRSSRPPSRARTSLGFSTERRRKEKEFFHAELQRLKDELRKESKKIKKPKVREHFPYTFTNLAPYCNTHEANYLIKMPDLGYKETQPAESKQQVETEDTLMYTTRKTAIGLCDPCESLNMDRSVLPILETAEIRRRRIEQMHAAELNASKTGRASSSTDRSGKTNSTTNNDPDSKSPRQKRPEASQGSTRLPKFPVIAPPNSDLTTKELDYGHVPMLRDELVKFSHFGEGRKTSDYERTKQDFFRMELDRLEEYPDKSRPHMRAAYFAYLQNTPGSRKAIYDCMNEVTSPKKKKETSPQAVA